MATDSPYSFLNDSLQQPYSQPFGSHFQPQGFGNANPANQGFAPANGLNSGNAILDLVINGIVRGITGGSGLRTFGRPETSDYASVAMRKRETFSREAMPSVLDGSRQFKTFEKLGENRIFQQFADQFSSGGSLGQSFNTVFGRFGNTLAGPGIGNLAEASQKSKALLTNLNKGFTNENGIWQYDKTSGLNRIQTIQAVDAYSRRFGGDQTIKNLALDDNNINKGKIDQSRAKVGEITEVMREAQNLFGPEKGFEELMSEVDNMLDGAKGMTTSKVRDTLQRIQAIGVVVDMNNEAMVQYMKVMDGLYKGMGYRGNNTASMSMNSLLAGKAIEDERKAKAEAAGSAYTGKSAQEIAQSLGEVQMKVQGSSEMMKIQLATNTLTTSGSSPAVLKGIQDKMAAGDWEGANKFIEESIKSGAINRSDADMIYRSLGLAEERGGLTSFENSQFENNLPPELRDKIKRGMEDPVKNAKIYESSFIEDMELNGLSETAKEILGGRAGELGDYMRNDLSADDMKDTGALKKKLMARFGIDEAKAGQLALNMNESFSSTMAARPGSESSIDSAWMNADQEAKYAEGLANAKNVQEEIGKVLGGTQYMRDLNIGEETMTMVGEAYKSLRGDGSKKVNGKDVLEYFKATGQKFMGNEAYVDALLDMSSETDKKSGAFTGRMEKIKSEADAEARKRAKGLGIDIESKRGKQDFETMKENIMKEKMGELQKEFGIGKDDKAAEKEKESGKQDDLNKILKAIEKVGEAIASGKIVITKSDKDKTLLAKVENSSNTD